MVENEGGKVVQEIKKCSRENDNLVNWLKLYDEQIKNHQKEIYNLSVKLYLSSQPSQKSVSPLQPPQSVSPLQPPQSVSPLQPPQSVSPLQPPQSVSPLQPPQSVSPLPLQSVSPLQPPQQSDPPSPKYKSLADYFKNQQ